MSDPDGNSFASSDDSPVLPPSKRMRFMDLPVDAIGEIARRVGDSFCTLAQIDPRLREICERIKLNRLESRHICPTLQHTVASSSLSLRVLVLNNCHCESSVISSLIMQCSNLTELSTVNSGLTTIDLVQCLKLLSQLESLSFSALDASEVNASFPDNHHVKRIYIEYNIESFNFAIDLINSCPRVQSLHFVAHRSSDDDSDHSLTFPFKISTIIWSGLREVVLACGTKGCNDRRVFDSVFSSRLMCIGVQFRDFRFGEEIVYDHGIFYLRRPSEALPHDETSLLKQMYSVGPEDPIWHYGQPRKLKIRDCGAWNNSGSLPPSLASVSMLVQLDLSSCHARVDVHIWDPLFRSSPGIEDLSVHSCFLVSGSYTEAKRVIYPFVKSIENLRLRRLTVVWNGYQWSNQQCPCEDLRSLPDLTALGHLEELTLRDPPASKDFLKLIANPNMTCLKIVERNYGHLYLQDLKTFFERCTKLRFLKLSWYRLQLHDRLLWWRLSAANLKQLCLESKSAEPINPEVARRFLPQTL